MRFSDFLFQEPLPEPTAAELAKEAEQEAAVFAQAANVDRLLLMLRQMDPANDNLADNDEIQVRRVGAPRILMSNIAYPRNCTDRA